MKHIIYTLLLTLACYNVHCENKKEIRVLQFNIWQEGTSVPGGYDAIIEQIDKLNPDFVTFSEVRNYNHTRFCDRIVSSLAGRNKTYYSYYSDDSGLLSRFPIQDSLRIFPIGEWLGGTIHKLTTRINNLDICVYTAHLDYKNYAPYLPRGYDGFTWKKLPAPITDVDSILESNWESQRDEAMAIFIQAAQKDIDAGKFVLLGGDFNEPSHRDWTKATKNLFDHHGCIVPWTSTIMLEKAGFIDSFRKKYPNPVTHPGFTYPADCKQVDISKLAWAPDADDRDRIDFIFYYPHKKVKLKDCVIVGPKGSIVRNKRVEETSKDVFLEPAGTWPTDHKALLTTFKLD